MSTATEPTQKRTDMPNDTLTTTLSDHHLPLRDRHPVEPLPG